MKCIHDDISFKDLYKYVSLLLIDQKSEYDKLATTR